jgi:hypothetical protein
MELAGLTEILNAHLNNRKQKMMNKRSVQKRITSAMWTFIVLFIFGHIIMSIFMGYFSFIYHENLFAIPFSGWHWPFRWIYSLLMTWVALAAWIDFRQEYNRRGASKEGRIEM